MIDKVLDMPKRWLKIVIKYNKRHPIKCSYGQDYLRIKTLNLLLTVSERQT